MKTILIFFSTIVFLSNTDLAFGTTRKKKLQAKETNTMQIRQEMHTISGIVRELGPYIASEKEFIRDANKGTIQKRIEEIYELFKNVKNHSIMDIRGLSLNQALMTEQLEQTVILFKNDQKSLARAKFNAALNFCVFCHTQSPGTVNKAPGKLFADKDINKLKMSDYEKAELYFISRDFEKAVKLYDQFIKASKQTDDDEFIYKALVRQLIYFIDIKKSFADAKNYFEVYAKNKNLNEKISQEIGEWIKSLSAKSLWDNFDPAKVKEEEMEKFMKTFIADDEEGPIFSLTNSSEVYDLNLSSILLDYFNAHPDTKHGAKILYWLAILDKRINADLFFSLGDYYLLACMEHYPKDPVAKECYESYVDDLDINFQGKSEKFFPKIKVKLRKLRELLDIPEEAK